jgi:hypothetical protein
MAENESTASTSPASAQPVAADRLLAELAETLDFAGVGQRHPEWNRERVCNLLRVAAAHLRPDVCPSVGQRLGALFPIVATFFAGRLLLLFGAYMAGMLEEFEASIPSFTRLALAAAKCQPDPVKILCTVLLVVCAAWAWSSQRRLRGFTTWAYLLGISLSLAYLLACLYPLLDLWLRADWRIGY